MCRQFTRGIAVLSRWDTPQLHVENFELSVNVLEQVMLPLEWCRASSCLHCNSLVSLFSLSVDFFGHGSERNACEAVFAKVCTAPVLFA